MLQPATDQLVSHLTPLPSDPNVISVRVGRRAVARLRAAEVEQLAIEVGRPWTEDLAHKAARIKQVEKTRQHAFRLLSKRGYSRNELADRLKRFTDDSDIAGEILDELEENHWVDDEAYARIIAEDTLRSKPLAVGLLIELLIRRQIDEDLARSVAHETLRGVDPVASAERLARDHQKKQSDQPPVVIARRIWGVLHRRGFDEQTIETVLHRLNIPYEGSPDGLHGPSIV